MIIPLVEDFAEFLGKFVVAGLGDVLGNGHRGGSDVTGYAGHRVSIAAEGDGADNGIHKRFRFKETDDGFGYALVAGRLEGIVRADLIGGAMEIVTEGLLEVCLDVGLRGTSSVQEDGGSNSLGTTDGFRGVVCNLGSGLRQGQTLIERLGIPGYRGHTHGTTVGDGTIRRMIRRFDPVLEFPTEGVHLITVGEVFEKVDE